jgi:hypothetical protein
LKCRRFGLSLNPKKSLFVMKEGKLLGHIVSVEGVRIDSIRVEAIQTLSLPRSRKEVQSFLGKINFLRRFVSNFAKLVKHITVMLRKGNEVKWTVESQESFSQIKKALTEAPVLVSPDYWDFLIFSFSSFDTVMVVLLQNNFEGLEQPISFFSRALRDAEEKYDIMEKQAYSLVKALKSLRVYVFHSKIIAYVPLASMKDILIQPDVDGRRINSIANILEFDLEIKPTKLVKGQGLAKLLVEYNCKDFLVNFINTYSEYQKAKLPDSCPQDNPPLVECTWYKDIIFFLQELKPPDGMGKRKARDLNLKEVIYFLIDQVLYWKDPLGVLLICLYPQEAQKIIFNFHGSMCGGHHFWRTIAYKILSFVYFLPALFIDVCAKVRTCIKCQKFTWKQ